MITKTATLIETAEKSEMKFGEYAAQDGEFRVYLLPVRQRTRRMKAHYRAQFWIADKCVSREIFESAYNG